MSHRFTESTIVVTGAGQGIGRAISLELATQVDRPLWLISRSREPLEETAQLCRQYQKRHVATSVCDLSNPEQLRDLERPERLPTLGMMVHNAGSFLYKPALETTEEELRSQWNLHALAPIELTRRFLPELHTLDRGLLVYIGSEVVRMNKSGHAAYASSKQALSGWVGSLREELRSTQIAATLIHPGQTFSQSWEGANVDPDQLADPADIARMVAELPKLTSRTVVSELWIGPQRGQRPPY